MQDSSEGAGSFDQVDLEVLSLFAEQASAALEASRLYTDLRNSYVDLKAAQDRLVRGERLRVIGEMTSGVAHEFNNLLTAILARVQLMELGDLPAEARDHLRLVEKASLDAAAVVRRLQGMSRAQRQGSHKVVDLAEVGADVVELLRPLWTTRRRHGRAPVTVRFRAPRGLFVTGDPTELREIFTNLIKNSLEAIDDRGGTVSVSISGRSGTVHAAVEDDGGGIAPEILSRLFTPFLTTKGDRGTGLGLCLCQQILERHGSSLTVTSGAPNGTRVSFELARAECEGPTPARETSPQESPLVRALRVMVVDDDPDVLGPLCDYLRRSGLTVLAADGAVEAVASAATFSPDVVVSDIAMPDTDGIDLCRSLRQAFPVLPVVLMSGQASEFDARRVKESGASALVSKPFTMKQMLDVLTSVSGSTQEKAAPASPGGRAADPAS